MFLLFLLVALATVTNGYNVTYEPEVFPVSRAGDQSTILVTITLGDEDKNVVSPSIQCADDFVCDTLELNNVEFTADNGYSATFNVTILSKFVGVTHLKIMLGDREVSPGYKLRIRRSEWDHKKANIFMGVIIVFIPIITFLMGTQLEWSKILQIGKKPIGPLTGMICQFLIMPMVAYLLAKFVIPEDETAIKLALFAAGTCPGGGKSSFWTIIYGGNLDLSISMTFTQNIAALVMMPLWIGTLGQEFSSKELQVPYMDIVKGLVALMVPSVLGMVFIHYKRHLYHRIQKSIKVIVWIATFVFFATSIYANFYIIWLLNWRIVLCGCVLPWSGYLLAFIVATIFRQNYADKITIAIETGIQHVGVAMIILMWTLPEPEVDLAIVVLFVIILVTDKPLVIMYGILQCYWKVTGKDKKKKLDFSKIDGPNEGSSTTIDTTKSMEVVETVTGKEGV